MIQNRTIREKISKLEPHDQNLLHRKCVSILHCAISSIAIIFIQNNPQNCKENWECFTLFWIGFLMSDLLVGMLTNSVSAGRIMIMKIKKINFNINNIFRWPKSSYFIWCCLFSHMAERRWLHLWQSYLLAFLFRLFQSKSSRTSSIGYGIKNNYFLLHVFND